MLKNIHLATEDEEDDIYKGYEGLQLDVRVKTERKNFILLINLIKTGARRRS